MKKIILNMVSLCMAFCLFTGCSGADTEEDRNRTQGQGIVSEQENTDLVQQPEGDAAVEPQQNTQMDTETEKSEEMEAMLQMKIGDTVVAVDWENNESVEALKTLCQEGPLTIQMSMYGGFEQVGPIGSRLPSADVQTQTSAGDIVLYSSDQIVVFYGSNSWAYTRLGHVADRDAAGMRELLGHGDVTITISMGDLTH